MNKLAKGILLILLVGSIAIVTSCNDKEDGNGFVAAELVGTWSFNSFDFSATINGVDFLKWFSDTFGEPESTYEEEFDGLGEELNEFEGIVMTFSEDGKVLASFPDEPDEDGTWVLNEETQKLTITLDDEPLELDILTLTSSDLVVSLSETGDFFDLDQDGTTEVLKVEMTIGMTK